MPPFLDTKVQNQIRELFKNLKEPVVVLFFGSQVQNCDYCHDTQQLLEEVTALSDKLSLDIYDFEESTEIARQYHVDKVPGYVLAGKNGSEIVDYGVRFSGVPAQYEFASLINDLVLVSGRDSGLSKETRKALANLKEPVNLQVFTTPT